MMQQPALKGGLAGDVAREADGGGIEAGRHLHRGLLFLGEHRLQDEVLPDHLLRLAMQLTHARPDLLVTGRLNVFEEEIDRLATAGVTVGCQPPPNARFCPQDSVTRGEMAAFLARSFRLTDTGDIYVLEVNASCYLEKSAEFAMAAQAAGIDYPRLIERIVNLAMERYEGRRAGNPAAGKLRETA